MTKIIRASILAAAMFASSPLVAHAQPTMQAPPVAQAQIDTKGWTLLGEQEVHGKRDRDAIIVGKYDGKFDQLQLVVLDSDIEMKDLTVFFANGEKWSPSLKHSFKEGQRSRVIDLPGKDRTINKIELLYGNTPGGGKAKVAVYGRDKKAALPPPPNGNPGPMPPQMPAFDPKGWTMLGEQTVDGRRDKDTIKVGKYAGQFDQLTMVVLDSDLELRDFVVKFGDNDKERWSPNLKHVFKEGQRSRTIDLPGKDRVIKKIELSYANLPGGGKAKVQIYGRDTGRKPVEIKPIVWENKGWTFLGKRTVDGWRDRDHLDIKDPNGYTALMFVVGGSDVAIKDIRVTLGNGEKFDLPGPVVFKEGTRTSPVDIPGKVRKIKSVDFAYANLPGGGRAEVEVWAQKKGTGAPPPPPPPTGTNPPTQAPPPPPPPPKAPTTAPPVDVRDHRTN